MEIILRRNAVIKYKVQRASWHGLRIRFYSMTNEFGDDYFETFLDRMRVEGNELDAMTFSVILYGLMTNSRIGQNKEMVLCIFNDIMPWSDIDLFRLHSFAKIAVFWVTKARNQLNQREIYILKSYTALHGLLRNESHR